VEEIIVSPREETSPDATTVLFGVEPRMQQKLMRHSDIRTADRGTDCRFANLLKKMVSAEGIEPSTY